MRRSFNLPRLISFKDTKAVLQTVALGLVVANLAAGWFVLRPFGGSAEELGDESAGLQTQLQQRRLGLDRTRLNVAKVEGGRVQGDQFMQTYFLTRRTAASNIIAELTAAAKEARIKSKVHSFNEVPIEGSSDLSMMGITGEYEGTYADLIEYVNRIDRSPRLLIIESLQATPQQGTQGLLNISIKFETFVREDDGLPVVTKEEPVAAETAAPEPRANSEVPAAVQPPQNAAPVQSPIQQPAAANLPAGVTVPQAPVQQPASPKGTIAPPPPPRDRLPMRMQMRRRSAETADGEDEQQPPPNQRENQ